MAVEFQDYYKILDVSKTATQQEIQKSYRKLARKYHPDINKEKNAEDNFKKISEAYEVLKNPESRKRYDMLGSSHHSGQPFNPGSWQNINVDFGDLGGQGASGFSSFFEQFFGGNFSQKQRRAPRYEQPAQDQEALIEISLEEAMMGTEKEFLIQDSPQHSSGRQLRVKIPPGATEGARIRLRAQGTQMSDLILIIKLKSHPVFSVQKRDLFINLDISPWEAALGASIKVPSLDNSKIAMKIPPSSQSGNKLRLRGKGLPSKNSPAGDLIVELRIVVPAALSGQEKALFEKLKEESKFNPRKE